jgi:hypothetical protein
VVTPEDKQYIIENQEGCMTYINHSGGCEGADMQSLSLNEVEVIPCIVPATGSYVINVIDTHPDYYTVVGGRISGKIVRKSKVVPIPESTRNFYINATDEARRMEEMWPWFAGLGDAYLNPKAIQVSSPADVEIIDSHQ